MQYTFIVWDQVHHNNHKTKTSTRVGTEWEKDAGYGYDSLITQSELYDRESGFVKDGKLHLVVVIRESTLPQPTKTEISSSDQDQANKFFSMVASKDYHDFVTLVTSDRTELKALKGIISEKSVVLQKMFEIDMVEKSEGVVKVIDFSGNVMQELLRFMSIGKVCNIDEIAVELYQASKTYQVDELLKICVHSIESTLDISNAFDVLPFADVNDEDELFDSCCNVIGR